jgi:trans-aconitate 2-methyltransferase
MPNWNAARYLRYANERTQPCRDLAARIEVHAPRTVIDLGCGPGNSTAVLAARWPDAAIAGLDNSAAMLESARRDYPSLTWVERSMVEWVDEPGPAYDVVFSNAALQWAPDHAALFPKLLGRSEVLAVQMPAAGNAPAQRLIREIAARRIAQPVADWHTHDPGFYYDVLAPLCGRLDLWETEYVHVLDGPEAIVEWYRGTGLRPFLSALPDDSARAAFLAEYLDAIRPYYPRRPDGNVLFPFRRLFLLAIRNGGPPIAS